MKQDEKKYITIQEVILIPEILSVISVMALAVAVIIKAIRS